MSGECWGEQKLSKINRDGPCSLCNEWSSWHSDSKIEYRSVVLRENTQNSNITKRIPYATVIW